MFKDKKKENDDEISYEMILEQFYSSVNSLRVFANNVHPSIEVKEREFYNKNEKIFSTVFTLIESKIKPDKYKVNEDEINEFHEKVTEKFGFKIKYNELGNGDYNIEMSDCILTDIFRSKLREKKLLENQMSILYQSSLISLVVFFELLISNLLRKRITDYPNSIGIKEKSLTLENIRKLGSLKDAEKYLIEKEVEGIMRGSLEDWLNYFVEKIKRKFKFLNNYKEDLIEIIQRRNLFVHNGGIVNNIYLSNISNKHMKNCGIGGKLIIDKDYLEHAIDVIEQAGELITLDIWKNADKNSNSRFNLVEEIAFEHMKKKHWKVASVLFEFLYNEEKITNKDRLRHKINYWQCIKWMGQYESIKNEIYDLDFTDKSLDFQLCMHALTDNYEMFFELLPKVYPYHISFDNLITWPIFREIKKLDEFRNFIEQCKKVRKGDMAAIEEVALTIDNIEIDEK